MDNCTADTGIFWAVYKPTGKVINIDEAIRGNDCNCVCIACGCDLQARQGPVRTHHFKHITSTECSPETILHQLAKRVFNECSYFNLPDGRGRFDYTSVKEEAWLQDQKPDIVLTGLDKQVHVEIAVTSFIDEVKEEKLVAKQYNTIEIDLSDISRNAPYENIKKIVIEETDRKQIIYWHAPMANAGENENKTLQAIIVMGVVALISWIAYRLLRKKRK